MQKLPLTLAIDTSCDETSCAVVHGLNILSNVLPSQNEYHSKYGGVVPSLARLAHQERIDSVVNEALIRSGSKIEDIEQIAVTIGPGLAIALEVGIRKAKELALEHNKPLLVVNHMEGHLFSGLAKPKKKLEELSSYNEYRNIYPAIGLLVSGKHTELVYIKKFGKYKIIGETLDDACGEAFDKAGRLLGLGYPAGPVIAKFAKENRDKLSLDQVNNNQSVLIRGANKKRSVTYELPVSMAKTNDYNFSYSGLKTAFRQLVESLSFSEQKGENKYEVDKTLSSGLNKRQILDLSVLFETAAFRPIEIKLEKAIKEYKPQTVLLGGGVIANARLRHLIRRICKKNEVNMISPTNKKLTTDNAAMIGVAANIQIMEGNAELLKDRSIINNIDRIPGLRLG